jgi:hypothetical protein
MEGISKYRIPRSRLANINKRNRNEYGLTIPSKNVKNYEPGLNEHVELLGPLGNYKQRAVNQQAYNWSKYMNTRNTVRMARNANNTRKVNTGKVNTRKVNTRKVNTGKVNTGNVNTGKTNKNNTRRVLF